MSGSFKDGSFAERFKAMGDQAEGMFELYATDVLGKGFVRYGLDRPPIQLFRLPARVRYTPDYLMSDRFVEVQGVGRDQKVKLKIEKHGCLHWWNDLRVGDFLGVYFYLWDSAKRREAFVPLGVLDALIASGEVGLNAFPEGKAYFEYPAAGIFDAAEELADAQAS